VPAAFSFSILLGFSSWSFLDSEEELELPELENLLCLETYVFCSASTGATDFFSVGIESTYFLTDSLF
jgi:hypothetical protein